MNHSTVAFPAILILLSISNLSCGLGTPTEKPTAPVVFTRKVHPEQISDLLNYPARVNARVNAAILSETNGIVSEMLVALGQKVKSQQVLMILSHTDPVYQYAPVQVLAPIAGIVSSIDTTRGSHVVEGQTLAAVINPSQLDILTEIPAQDLSLMNKGAMGEFRVPGQKAILKVEVSGVSPFVKPGTGTASAKLALLAPADLILSPGMQGQVSFKANNHSGFLIPDTAIVYKGKNTFVNVVVNQKIQQIAVDLGAKQRGFVEVLKGLSAETELVERASRSVAEGEAVTVEHVPTT